MRKIDLLLNEYGESHQDHTNKAIHWVCVPVIVWTVMALISEIPTPAFFGAIPYLSWLTILLAATLVYYLMLSPPLTVGFIIYAVICIFVMNLVEIYVPYPLWKVALGVFVLAWIGQFWGHKIEGKKPSFFKDVQFLMIGPAWLLSFLYKRWGISY